MNDKRKKPASLGAALATLGFVPVDRSLPPELEGIQEKIETLNRFPDLLKRLADLQAKRQREEISREKFQSEVIALYGEADVRLRRE